MLLIYQNGNVSVLGIFELPILYVYVHVNFKYSALKMSNSIYCTLAFISPF